ncbi:hypothetical protein, partial [Streptomyces sp. NPDC005568]|uniref:hypothetical protein n=1 Tax=Streptomyces sp. NPDC005568 TaxID=3156887 RepID=UPI0033BE38F0
MTGRAPGAERASGDDYVWFAGIGREEDPGSADERVPGSGPVPSARASDLPSRRRSAIHASRM